MGPTESGRISHGASVIEYSVSRSARRKKTIQIRVDVTAGVLVAAPLRATKQQIAQVVEKRSAWILQRTIESQALARPRAFVSGETLPYRGRELPLEVTSGVVAAVRIQFDGRAFTVIVPAHLPEQQRAEAIRAAFAAWYRRRALELVEAAVARWSPLVGAKPKAVKVRDQRQRWGSCSADGTLRFNWRLAMADPQVLEYVVVHELTHLLHRSHAADFWATLEAVMPDYRLSRARLKATGPFLIL